ncbi:MAG TPA: enoyl-CoA hydratase-related protein, partial [Sphingomonadales bacterium]
MSGMNEIASWRREGAVAVLKIDSPPVNALSHAVRIALHEGVTRAAEDDAVKALVILCGGRTFFAGADITEFGKPIQPPLLKNIMAVIEASTKPVIAAMHGNALGGGLEVALACHYRVALASTRIGLPESALGLLPGAGGTQRVPRLIGVEKAVEMIVFGEPYPAPRARELGLIDAVIAGDDLEAGAIAYALELVDGNAPLRRVRDQAPDLDRDAARALFARFRADHPKLFRNLRAPENILRAIEAAVILPFDEGIAREAELSRELVASPESAAQRHIFFAERAAAKLPAKVAEDAVPTIAAVRIVGDHTDDLSAIFARAGFSLARDGVAEADLVVITADNPD